MTYKDNEVYIAHKKIGFPKLDKKTQIDILLNDNLEPIKCLIPDIQDKGFPLGLLNEYITITKTELKAYMKQINYLDKKIAEYSETYDGFWLRKNIDTFEFFQRERGNSFDHQVFKTEDEVLDPVINIIGWCCKD
jgi:hypothetical protein